MKSHAELAQNENLLMNTVKLTILLVACTARTILAADHPESPITLESAREAGRRNSRFLQENDLEVKAPDAIPTANVTFFQKTFHEMGPKKATGPCHENIH